MVGPTQYLRSLMRDVFLCWAVTLAAALPGLAQDLPTRPIRVIVPFVAGSSIDARMRMMGAALADRLKQQVIIDNRPGAGGSLGTTTAAQSAPDGSTWLFTNNSYTINPYVLKDAAYDPVKAMIPLNRAYVSSLVVVVNATSKARSLKELVAVAKADPASFNYGSSGIGSLPHFSAELFFHLAGLSPLHIPFKGDTQVLTEVLGGRIGVAFSGIASAQPHIASGRLRALAVTSAQRQSSLPDVPGMHEAGYADYNDSIWTGFFLPIGTPARMVERLNREITATLSDPDLRKRMAATGADAAPLATAAYGDFIRAESTRYARLVKMIGLKPE